MKILTVGSKTTNKKLIFQESVIDSPNISWAAGRIHYENLFKYIENFTTKNWKFSDKNSDIFHISAQNIDCG